MHKYALEPTTTIRLLKYMISRKLAPEYNPTQRKRSQKEVNIWAVAMTRIELSILYDFQYCKVLSEEKW